MLLTTAIKKTKKIKKMYTSVPNESLDQLLDISPKRFIFSKTFDLEF